MATISLVGIASNDQVPGLTMLHASIDHNAATYYWTESVALKTQTPQAYLEANLADYVSQIDTTVAATMLHPVILDPITSEPVPPSGEPMTTEEKIAFVCGLNEMKRVMREERNKRLTASDWTQLSDSPLDSTAKASWATYRQDLRDVPEQTEFPTEITWPVEP
jgi:hypothetical protein